MSTRKVGSCEFGTKAPGALPESVASLASRAPLSRGFAHFRTLSHGFALPTVAPAEV